MAGTLVLAGLANAIIAAVFLATGLRLAFRPVERTHALAVVAIALWWLSMGFLEVVQAAETLAVARGAADLDALQADRYLNGAFLGIGCWGLAFHVAYLGSGNRAWAWRLAPVYVVAAAAHWALSVLDPMTGIQVQSYSFGPEYGRPLIEVWVAPVVVATIGGTMVLAPAAYLWLGRRLKPSQRRRSVLVSTGVLLWGAAGFSAHIAESPAADFLTVTGMAAVAAVFAYFAYFPPRFVSRGDEPGPFVQVAVPTPETELFYERAPPPHGGNGP